MSNSLSSMMADVTALMNTIDEATKSGDFDSAETAQAFLDSVIKPALATKIDAIAYILNTKLPAQAQERKEFLEQVRSWAGQPDMQIKSLKQYLKQLWEVGAIEDELKGSVHTITLSRMTQPAIEIDQQVAEQEWDAATQHKFGEIRVEYKPDKKSIELALKKGKDLPPGVTTHYGARLSIKMSK